MYVADVEHHHLHIGLRGIPFLQRLDFRKGNAVVVELGHAIGIAHDFLDGFFQTHESHFAVMGIEAVADIFQEVGLTRTEIAVNPNAYVAALVLADIDQNVIEVDDDFFGEHVFHDFSHHGIFTEVGCRHSRIHFAVETF